MGVAKNKNHFKNNNFFIFIPKVNKIEPIVVDLNIKFEELLEISSQKEIVLKNTQNFLKDQPSNNILLWGAKGMGKSTLIKCVVDYVNSKSRNQIKLVEVLNSNINNLIDIVYQLSKIEHKFVIYIDDISFKKDESDFRLFKTLIEGSLLSHVNNVKYYITSNLRHLSHKADLNIVNDLESKESNQNLISLSDRFGCWVGFYDSNQEQFLKIVKYYLKKFSIKYSKDIEKLALRWTVDKGNFSGRTAEQFVKNIKINNIF